MSDSTNYDLAAETVAAGAAPPPQAQPAAQQPATPTTDWDAAAARFAQQELGSTAQQPATPTTDWDAAAARFAQQELGSTAIQPATPTTDWDAAAARFAQQELGSTALQIRNSLLTVGAANPDEAAVHQHMARALSVPPESVQQDPQWARQQILAASVDAGTLARRAPHLAQFLADPQNAAISHDDIAQLSGVETAVQQLPKPAAAQPSVDGQVLTPLPEPQSTLRQRIHDWAAGVFGAPSYAQELQQQQAAEAVAILAGREGGLPAPEKNITPQQIEEARKVIASGGFETTPGGAVVGGGKHAVAAAQSLLRQAAAQEAVAQQMSDNMAWERSRQAVGGMSQIPVIGAQRFLKSASFGLAAPLLLEQPHSPEASLAAAGGQLGGFIVGPARAAGGIIGAVPGAKLLAPRAGETWIAGLAKNVAQQSATLGLASALEESGSAVLDSASAGEAASKIGQAALGGAGLGATFGAAGKVFPENTLAQFFGRAAGVSAVQDLISGQRPWDDRPLEDKIFGYGLNAWFSLRGAGRTTGGWFINHPEVAKGFADAEKAQAAQTGHQALQNLAALAAASKTRQRAPDTFKELVQRMTDGGQAPPEVYVSAKDLEGALRQSGVSGAQLAEKLPDVVAQLSEALQTDGDIRITTADFTTHIAGGPAEAALLPHLKFDPDGMTYQQSEAWLAGQQQEMQRQAEKIVADKQAGDARAASARVVYDNILGQLDATRRFSPEVNRAYAALTREWYATMADHLGITPDELFQQHPLRVAAEGGAGGTSFELQTYYQAGRAQSLRNAAYDKNPFMTFLATHGIYHRAGDPRSLKSEFSPDRSPMVSGYGPIFKSRGLQVDELLPRAIEEGYLRPDATESDMYSLIADAMRGERIEPVYSAGHDAVLEEQIRARHEADYQDYLEAQRQQALDDAFAPLKEGDYADSDFSGQKTESASPEQQTEAAALRQQLEELGVDTYSIAERIAVQYPDLSDQQFHEHLTDAYRAAAAQAAEQRSVRDTGGDRTEALPAQAGREGGAGAEPAKPERQPGVNGSVAPRGAFIPDTHTIALLKGADLSTFLHESGHFFLKAMRDIAARPDAPEAIRQDMAVVGDWYRGNAEAIAKEAGGLSVEQVREYLDRGTTGDAQRDAAIDRALHEQWARGFEKYLMEGKAPTTEMQGLFGRFRAWLINVYQSLRELNVSLTPEVRGVFDRMLATEDAIRQAERVRGYKPLFETAEMAGMTPEAFAEYQALGASATEEAVADLQQRSLRDMQWMAGAKGRALRELQKQAATARKAVREEVTKQVMAEPIERARRWLKTGEMETEQGETIKAEKGYKLNTAEVKAMYPESMLARPDLEKLRGLTGPEGRHPDLVAEMFGFHNGDDLVRELIDAEPTKSKIDGLTDAVMLERHGELTDPQSVERAAEAAIHNEARARFVATEFKALAQATGPARELAAAAKEAAQAAIAAKRVGDIRPAQYEAAEARAGREAEKAMAANDIPGAAFQKRAQLLSNRLARAATDALEQVRKIVQNQKRFDKDSIRKNMDADVLEQIDALRERFDFRQQPKTGPTKKQQSLREWTETQKGWGYTPVENAAMLDEAVRKPYREMTMEEIRGFHDTLRSLERIARERKTMLVEGKKVQVEQVVGELVGKMQERGQKFTLQQLLQPARRGVDPLWRVTLERTVAWLRAAGAEVTPIQYKANDFDQHQLLGPFTRAIFNRVFDANYRKVDMLRTLSRQFRAVADELGVDWQKSLNQRVSNRLLVDDQLSELAGETVYRSLTRGEMLGIARHVGNESNLDKLTRGMGWRAEDVWRFLSESMTDKDWRATQAIWDAFEQYWPQMAEMNRRLGNETPEHVQPRAFRTPSGIDMRGGYAPIDYDPMRSRLGVKQADASAINPDEALFGRSYFRADTTTNGSLNARVANYHDRIDLDFHSLEKRLHDTIHDLAYREALLDVHKVLSDKTFRREFQLTYGPEQYKSLQEWVGNIANGQNMDSRMGAFGRFMSSTRTAMVASGIAYRMTTVAKHGSSALVKSAAYFGGGGQKYFLPRLAQVFTNHRDLIASAIEKFPEIRARALQQDRDYREMTASLYEPESLASKNKRWGHAFVAYGDLMSAAPTAWAAYDRAITEGIPVNRGGTGKPMNEADAIAYASQVVREAHGSNIEAARRRGRVGECAQAQFRLHRHAQRQPGRRPRRRHHPAGAAAGRLHAHGHQRRARVAAHGADQPGQVLPHRHQRQRRPRRDPDPAVAGAGQPLDQGSAVGVRHQRATAARAAARGQATGVCVGWLAGANVRRRRWYGRHHGIYPGWLRRCMAHDDG